jgi:GH24 family phage-related lysozyme (muramidase)
MKQIKKLLRMLSVMAVCALFMLPAMAADETDALYVFSTETVGEQAVVATQYASAQAAVPTYTSGDQCLEIIKQFEGFYAMPYQDTLWTAIGYGSRYSQAQEKFGQNCAPITEAQAVELVRDELASIEKTLNSFLQGSGITVSQAQFDALASFTYNVGTGWTTYKNTDGSWCKLKVLLLEGPSAWTEARVQEAFGTWVKDANGNQLSGLVKRRAAEAALFVSGGTGSTGSTGVFRDVSSSAWYYSYVMEAYEKGIVSGNGDGTFSPDGALTRAQLVKLLANFDGVELSGYTASSFTDVAAGTWYTAPIAWAAAQGYVTGYEDGTFHPNDTVTREQMCTILSRYLADRQYITSQTLNTFTDGDQISDYAAAHVYACAALDLISGMEDGSFSPKSGATRAQAAAIFVRMCSLG